MDSAAPETPAEGGGSAPRVTLGKGRALVPVPAPAPSAFAALGRSHGIVAAGVAAVMGLGFVAGTAAFASKTQTVVLAQAAPLPADPTAEALTRVQGEVRALKASLDGLRASAEDARGADTIRGLKRSVEALRQDLDGAKAASAGAVGQLGAKIDRLDRDPGPKLAEIAARLDRLDPDAKLAQLASRVERVERQVASVDATASIPAGAAATAAVRAPAPPARPAAPVPAVAAAVPPAAVPPARPEPSPTGPKAEAAFHPEPPARPEPSPTGPKAEAPRPEAPQRAAALDGWLLRDVYGGVALVEGRAGGLREVAPGEFVPGVGEIRSIERRGRGWVVVTSRGLIVADNRW